MIFKCKNCGGNAVYSPEKLGMFCPFCDSENSEERKDYTESALEVCPNCGGEVKVEQHTSATQCPYCDNYLIFNARVEGEFTPKMIIPFQMGKEACKNLIREKFKKKIFAPTGFLSEVKLNTVEGIYVPFWFFDYDVNCNYVGEGTKTRSWRAGDREYTETSYFDIRRNMDAGFERIPIDASVAMPDAIMDWLEPYDYSKMCDFKPEYMSGFNGEKYNMVADLVESRAKIKVSEDLDGMLKATYHGYNSVRTKIKDVNYKTSQSNYGLLPVWKYIYNYKDVPYAFYVNGQTGKIVGKAPISMPKIWAYAATLWGCLMALLIMISCMGLF